MNNNTQIAAEVEVGAVMIITLIIRDVDRAGVTQRVQVWCLFVSGVFVSELVFFFGMCVQLFCLLYGVV